MNVNHKNNKGFTIIELMLAMTFISILLLSVVAIVIHVGSIYSRGMVLKDINQYARSIDRDVRRTASSSGGVDIASDYLVVQDGGVVLGGRLCLGSYSYVWNTARGLEKHANSPRIVKYSGSGSDNNQPVRFAKVEDIPRAYCAKDSRTGFPDKTSIPIGTTSSEMMRTGDHKISIQSVNFSVADKANNLSTGFLYRLDYTIGSGSVEAMNQNQKSCLPPSDPKSDPMYCSVQSFSIVSRGGGV